VSEEIQAGAGCICVGVFCFQVVEDTDIAGKALKAVAQMKRARPWDEMRKHS